MIQIAGKVLVDTNVVVGFLNHEDWAVRLIGTTPDVRVPVIVVGELIAGALGSARVASNLALIDQFVAEAKVVGCDLQTARQFGEVRAHLRARGRPIPENDIWIAALARQYAIPLATRDRHFDEVPEVTRVVV